MTYSLVSGRYGERERRMEKERGGDHKKIMGKGDNELEGKN